MELRLSALTKRFKDFTAVNGVSCAMSGGVYGLLGINGAGKTTLMRMLCTLIPPSEGEITLDGADIFQMGADYRRILGYLPQDFGCYPDFSAEDYLRYIASIKGLSPVVAHRRIDELLHSVGLDSARKKKTKTFSGGMKRRLGIAQAMLNDPHILILDEPTAGLDPNERVRFRNLISALAQDRLVLLSTHIVSDVEYIAGEIFLMKDGEIVHSGSVRELIADMPERVWLCTVPREQAAHLERDYKVANVRLAGGGAQLRILSAEPPFPNAEPAEATLEDVFLSYFGQTGGELE